jgi:hypothetical protein
MELLFFCSIGAVAATTVVLGILNWLYLSFIGSKVAQLENEVEKKALEFESAKKERLALTQAAKNALPLQEKTETAASQSDSPQIEVVRNVRGGGFDHVDMDMDSHHKHNHADQDYQSSEPAIQHPSYQMPQSENLMPIAAKPFDETFEPTTFGPEMESHSVPPASHFVTVALYSKAKQDTDFTAAWKTLSEQLASLQSPNVHFDFTGVLFLYDRELQYLEKFKDVVLRAGGKVSFVHCDNELLNILRNRPTLAPLVGLQQQSW